MGPVDEGYLTGVIGKAPREGTIGRVSGRAGFPPLAPQPGPPRLTLPAFHGPAGSSEGRECRMAPTSPTDAPCWSTTRRLPLSFPQFGAIPWVICKASSGGHRRGVQEQVPWSRCPGQGPPPCLPHPWLPQLTRWPAFPGPAGSSEGRECQKWLPPPHPTHPAGPLPACSQALLPNLRLHTAPPPA